MENIFELQKRFDALEQSSKIHLIDENTRAEFAKISISFGKVADYIDVIDSPEAAKLKPSDIVFYQENIQKLMSSIQASLSNIEESLK